MTSPLLSTAAAISFLRWRHTRRNVALNRLAAGNLSHTQIVFRLEKEPVERIAAEVSRQPQGGIAGHATALEQNVINAWCVYANGFSKCSRTQTGRLQKIFAQDLSGMHGWRGKLAHECFRLSFSTARAANLKSTASYRITVCGTRTAALS